MHTAAGVNDGHTADGDRDGGSPSDGHTADGDRNGGSSGDGGRLMSLLRDLVREEGKMEAAEMLGVNYKTLVRALNSGRMSRRMGEAVERLLAPGDGEDSVRSRQRERIELLEGRVGALERRMEAVDAEMRDTPREVRSAVDRALAEAGTGLRGLRDEHGRALRALAERMARVEAGASTRTAQPGGRRVGRELDPLLVTEKPADGDEQVYGAAWPAVAEWRRLRADHPDAGSSLPWLDTEERLLTLELEMLERFGLTLPPEKEPLRGFGRAGQVNWRRAALLDTRLALARKRRLRRVLRVLTLGRWRG